MYVIVALIYFTFAFIGIVPMHKSKQNKELFLYVALIVFSFTISMLLIAHIKLPSPADFIENTVSTFTKK